MLVEARDGRSQVHPPLLVGVADDLKALAVARTGNEAGHEGGELAPGHQTHRGAVRAEPFGADGAVGEQLGRLGVRDVDGKRREPDLQPGLGGVFGGGTEPLGVATGDPHGVAVQFSGDDAHVARGDVGGEVRAAGEPGKETGVVVDSSCSHAYECGYSCSSSAPLAIATEHSA
ncbi:hypothetical protein AB0I28_21810 [Phytomonospora sp. NPDC050363]|uniref:hypothetical protein n=1 Tax=Phytomonospora sp. NPDC050363 TaxID=3155642 RepID=UPI0033CC7342